MPPWFAEKGVGDFADGPSLHYSAGQEHRAVAASELSLPLANELPPAESPGPAGRHGTELQAVAWFDNSRDNPHNPDPDAAVRWGEQTSDEMMVGFFDVAVDPTLDKQKYFERAPTSPSD
jgi:hypothetical protein